MKSLWPRLSIDRDRTTFCVDACNLSSGAHMVTLYFRHCRGIPSDVNLRSLARCRRLHVRQRQNEPHSNSNVQFHTSTPKILQNNRPEAYIGPRWLKSTKKSGAHYPNRTSDLVITSDTPYHLMAVSGKFDWKLHFGITHWAKRARFSSVRRSGYWLKLVCKTLYTLKTLLTELSANTRRKLRRPLSISCFTR